MLLKRILALSSGSYQTRITVSFPDLKTSVFVKKGHGLAGRSSTPKSAKKK